MRRTKEVIQKEINDMEILADHYSRTDRIEYQRVETKLKVLNDEYLELMVEKPSEVLREESPAKTHSVYCLVKR